MLKIAVVLEPCEEGGYAVTVPTIPGCFSQGETEQEALKSVVEAIELHLEASEDNLFTVSEDVLIRKLHWEFVSDSGEAVSETVSGSEVSSVREASAEDEPESESQDVGSGKRQIQF